jgi:lysophospholipase L1-like esterase
MTLGRCLKCSTLLAGALALATAGCESGKPRGAAAPPSATQRAPSATETTSERSPAVRNHAPAPAPSGTPAPQPPAVAKAPCTVALIGDSITDYRSFGGGYARYLEQRCPRSRFLNFAKGGAMVNQMRASFESTLANEPRGAFTHVVVFGGVNDLYSDETAGRTPAKIEADLTALYAGAHALGARVVAITVAPWGGFTRYFTPHRAETTRELNAWILGRTESGMVDVAVDAHALLSCGDPERLCPRYERARSDGLHFGNAGHDVLGAALYEREFFACE